MDLCCPYFSKEDNLSEKVVLSQLMTPRGVIKVHFIVSFLFSVKFRVHMYENNHISVYVDKFEIWIVITEVLVNIWYKSLKF